MTRAAQSEPDSPAPPDDAALVAAIARGDREALGLLYDRYASATLALVLRIVRSRAHAEELLTVARRSRQRVAPRRSGKSC